MKKPISIILAFILLLSAAAVPVYADNDVQRIWGQLTTIGKHKYVISDENGAELITAEAAADGLTLSLGAYAWFTVETQTDEYGDYLCITNYETIPEYGYKIGYLSRVYKQWDDNGENVYIELCAEEKENMRVYTVQINGKRYRDDDIITALTPQVGNFMAYKLDEYGDINDILSVDIKTPHEKYKLNSDTKFFIKTGGCYQIGSLPDGYNYSYEVLSYDKNYNARAVKVTDLYKTGVAFYSHSLNRTEYDIALVNADGEKKLFDLSENCIISDTVTAENFDGIIEYKINTENEITEITALTGSDFNGYTVKDGKIGENTVADTVIFEVIDNAGRGHAHEWIYTKFNASDKLQYSGKAFTSSGGKRILWITGNGLEDGKPAVDFWAKANVYDSYIGFRVGATYEKNGYTGSGTISLAVYCKGRLCDIYTYSLADEESVYDETYDELGSVIEKRVYYDESTDINDYTVTGFVWYDDLSPICPAVPVEVN